MRGCFTSYLRKIVGMIGSKETVHDIMTGKQSILHSICIPSTPFRPLVWSQTHRSKLDDAILNMSASARKQKYLTTSIETRDGLLSQYLSVSRIRLWARAARSFWLPKFSSQNQRRDFRKSLGMAEFETMSVTSTQKEIKSLFFPSRRPFEWYNRN